MSWSSLPYGVLVAAIAVVGCGSPLGEGGGAPVAAGSSGADGGSGGAGAGGAGSGGGLVGGAAPVRWPLEVLGAPGVEVTLPVHLDAGSLDAGPVAIELTVHNVVASGAAELIVNGGAPIDLGAPGVGLLRPTGDVARARVDLGDGALREGHNDLVFRYARQVPDVSGFRVLAASLVADGVATPIQGVEDDPTSWAPIATDADTIERGRRAFQEETRDGGPTCARCHTDSGADLAYFALSDRSLVARAEHHLFSTDEAEAIASYLRSLGVAPVGRPWIAPFQPGPDNHGSVGASLRWVLGSDAELGEHALPGGLPSDPAWDLVADVDTFHLPTSVPVPSWFRWLPRFVDERWFSLEGGVLGAAEQRLRDEGSTEAAIALQTAAIQVGKHLLVEEDDHEARVEVLRFAAVKLWDWSRRRGFDAPDHGFPDGGPAYPYEVGFAFFEAAMGDALPHAWEQAAQWWWAQLAVDPGRGLSNGDRPLNYDHVLVVAESAGVGPNGLAFLHLLGSWEESRGAMAPHFGTDRGPVRLLEVPMRSLDAPARVAILRRFLREQARFLDAGGALDDNHVTLLADAWEVGCQDLDAAQRSSVREVAAPAALEALTACP